MLYMVMQHITELLYYQMVDKKFNKYDDLLESLFIAIDYIGDDKYSAYDKECVKEVIRLVVEMDKVSIEDKVELRGILKELDEQEKIYESLDDLIKCLFIPKVDKNITVDNTLYTSSYKLFDDFRKIVVKRSEVSKRHREKVYGYMYYISNVILTELDKSDYQIKDDDKDLIWILRMILKTDEFRDAYECISYHDEVTRNKGMGLYFKYR